MIINFHVIGIFPTIYKENPPGNVNMYRDQGEPAVSYI